MIGNPAISRKQERIARIGTSGTGSSERARPIGLDAAQHDDAGSDEDEGEQRSDVGQLNDFFDRCEGGKNRDEYARDDGRNGRRPVLGMQLRGPGR
jgi:hypothetical protein